MQPIYPTLEALPPDYPRRPDGLVNLENRVWQAFRLANLDRITQFYANVHCGSVPGLTDDMEPHEVYTRTAMYAKRADLVVETAAEVWLLEVKASARAAAIGQLITYAPLLQARKATWTNPRPILIANSFDPDAAELCKTLAVLCLTPPFSPLDPR